MAEPMVAVRGLAKLRRDLGTLDREFRKGLDRGLKKAAQPIALEARKRYRRRHPRRRGGRGSQRGIRFASGAKGARVVLGGTRYPHLLGQEFGTNRLARFPPRSPSVPGGGSEGYFFYPAIRDGASRLVEDVEDVIDRASRREFAD